MLLARLLLLIMPAVAAATAAETLNTMLDGLEKKASDLAAKIAEQHSKRCDLEYQDSCEGSMYDSCTAELPESRCDSAIRAPLCGALCGLSFDYTTSTVTLPPESDVKGISIPDRIKETACYTNALEPMFKANNKEFNATGLYKVLPNQYFGDRHGFFRMYPGRHFEKCGEYDPRERPWYLAGSAAPRSVIIIMDLSGSMASKIGMSRSAAKHLISTLTFADSFAVLAIAGDGVATVYPRLGGFAYGTNQDRANADGVVATTTWAGLEVLNQVTRLTGTQSSLQAVYATAFDMWNATAASSTTSSVEASSGEVVLPGEDACVKAIALLTDATLGYVTATMASTYIAQRNAEHKAALFFYTLGASVGIDGQAPKAMACTLNGVWAAIPTKEQHEKHTAGANPDALRYGYDYSYYMAQFSKYFEILLGTSTGAYTVWSEPYLFYPSNLLGTTVSSPIFDRTVPDSPRLLGVVGVDIVISAGEKAMMTADPTLTDVAARSLILAELAKRARRRCPVSTTVGECDLQAVRRYSGGEKGLCAGQCWRTTSFDQAACLDYHKYPRPRPGKRGSLFANDHWNGKPGRDRVCCGIGTGVKKNLFTRQGMCRDRGGSSSTTVLSSGGSAAEARYISVTYSEDWTNWVGAEEICRNQGYGLATIDTDSEPTIMSMMQAAGVNQVWSANAGGNPVLMAAIFGQGRCGFIGRRFVNGAWVLSKDMYTECSTPMGYICDTKTKSTGISPTVSAVLVVLSFVVLLLMCCCCCAFRQRLAKCFKRCVPGNDKMDGI